MSDLRLLVWLTQLGLSVAVPMALSMFAGIWLRNRFGLGAWVIVIAAALGILWAANGLLTSLRTMERMSKSKKDDDVPPPVSFNDHE